MGTIAAASEAMEMLTGDTARCPTCLRGINAAELAGARAEHEHRLIAATEAAERHSAAQREQRARSSAMADLLTRLESLRAPIPPEITPAAPDLMAAEAAHAAALEALEEHNRAIGTIEAKLQQLQSNITTDNQVAESERELFVAYRRGAVAIGAAQAFHQAVTQVTEDLIEPIATEVRWRWKQLFSNDGLTFRPDGTIVRMAAGQELGWDTLSDGERIWARVVTHLLVLASFTRLPFAWFDEPLEHLDPKLRQTVAATLATATKGGHPIQLLVTTYENALARQLAEDTANASLVNLRTSTDPYGPDDMSGHGFQAPRPTRRAS